MAQYDDHIDDAFLGFASDILADTSKGLSGTELAKVFRAYSVRHKCSVEYPSMPSPHIVKRSLCLANLESLSTEHQFRIISELCDHEKLNSVRNAGYTDELKLRLHNDYGHLNPDPSHDRILPELVEQTKHWLDEHDESLELYNQALEKYRTGLFHRNMLDDLRLSLEKLLCDLLANGKSLENQKANVGLLIKNKGGSKELQNMFVSLISYYCDYQNTYVKHDSSVKEQELELVLELTSSFMKHLIRLSSG